MANEISKGLDFSRGSVSAVFMAPMVPMRKVQTNAKSVAPQKTGLKLQPAFY